MSELLLVCKAKKKNPQNKRKKEIRADDEKHVNRVSRAS